MVGLQRLEVGSIDIGATEDAGLGLLGTRVSGLMADVVGLRTMEGEIGPDNTVRGPGARWFPLARDGRSMIGEEATHD